jgi:hypothetical protein
MWRVRNGLTLLSLIIALSSAAAAQPGVTPEHRPAQGDSDEISLWRAEFWSRKACWTALDM